MDSAPLTFLHNQQRSQGPELSSPKDTEVAPAPFGTDAVHRGRVQRGPSGLPGAPRAWVSRGNSAPGSNSTCWLGQDAAHHPPARPERHWEKQPFPQPRHRLCPTTDSQKHRNGQNVARGEEVGASTNRLLLSETRDGR